MFLSLAAMGAFFYLKQENGDRTPENLGWLPLLSLIIYVSAFSVGLGPIPWLIGPEIVPSHVKGNTFMFNSSVQLHHTI